MKTLKSLRVLLFALLAGTAATAQQTTILLNACYQSQNRFIRVVRSSTDCRADEDFVNLSMEGIANPAAERNSTAPDNASQSDADAVTSTAPSRTDVANPARQTGALDPAEPSPQMSTRVESDSLDDSRGAGGDASLEGLPGPKGSGIEPDTSPLNPPETNTGPWSSTTAYKVGDEVTYNGLTYLCVKVNTNVAPPNATYWQYVEPPFPSVFGTNRFAFSQGNTAGASCTLGSLIVNASSEYATNYLPADGRLLPINGNTALFSLIGINYGGDGKTNFGLPDLRAATPTNTIYLICVSGVFPAN